MNVKTANMANHHFTERPLNGYMPYHLIQPGLGHVESVMASPLTEDGMTLYLNKTNRDLTINKYDVTKPMYLYDENHSKTYTITTVEFFPTRPYNTIVCIEEIEPEDLFRLFIRKLSA